MPPIPFAIVIAMLPAWLPCQQPLWQRLGRVRTSASAAMVSDLARERAVLVCWEDTFEWLGGRWAHRAYTPALQANVIALTYDVQRGVTVLFGGQENSYSDETWEYDGRAWQLRQPPVRPMARWTSMAHDLVRGRTVLFGGLGGVANVAFSDETWEWDGVTWSLATPVVRPAARVGHALAYDLIGLRLLLFGGSNTQGGLSVALGDTWSWDGSAWVQLAPANAPPARAGHAMALDLSRGRIVLFGGSGGPFPTLFDDTWEWDGSTWTQAHPSSHPSMRSGSAMALEPRSGRVLLFGGGDAQTEYVDTWSWDGTQWRLEADGLTQGAIVFIAADTVRGQLLSFGRTRGVGGTPTDETWVGNGIDWTRRLPAQSPSARRAPMACDAARQEVVLFGGSDGVLPLGDTWCWNGTTWTQRFPATSPNAGIHRMVYDAQRQVVVLCEQNAASGLIDVWYWNGAAWSLQPASARPSPRWGAAIDYDAANQRLVLFGGWHAVCAGANCTNVVNFADTWLWDGVAWTQANPPVSPSARSFGVTVYDPDRHCVHLVGGVNRLSPPHTWLDLPVRDAWEWNGTTWTGPLPIPATYPGTFTWRQAAYDPELRRPLLFSSDELATITAVPSAVQAYGVGCAGSLGLPWLASGEPTLGNQSFALDVGALPSLTPCFVGLAFSAASTPIGAGCSLLLGSPVAILATSSNIGGVATLLVPIPAAPMLRGLAVHAQALALDVAAPSGFSMTAGLRLTIGD